MQSRDRKGAVLVGQEAMRDRRPPDRTTLRLAPGVTSHANASPPNTSDNDEASEPAIVRTHATTSTIEHCSTGASSCVGEPWATPSADEPVRGNVDVRVTAEPSWWAIVMQTSSSVATAVVSPTHSTRKNGGRMTNRLPL